ncbi:MAG: 16S rRNA (guanine(527)-N(7))-methyltransferase RsmG [Burkholderiales bacterium]
MPPEMGASDLRNRLEQGAAALGVSLIGSQVDTLLAYLALIERWNRVYNLTALRQADEMLTHHLLDSLAVVPALQRHLVANNVGSARLLDVGSGAGLPGVVLAIVLPELQVTCIDTVGKKASFIQQVASELTLRNLRSQHARVEAWAGHAGEPGFDIVTSRAFSSLADFVGLTRGHLAPQGVWLAMKGKRPSDEERILPGDVDVFHVEQLRVPGLEAERCLLWMRAR